MDGSCGPDRCQWPATAGKSACGEAGLKAGAMVEVHLLDDDYHACAPLEVHRTRLRRIPPGDALRRSGGGLEGL
eukprot:5398368-Karenia_brevis.AAC.1